MTTISLSNYTGSPSVVNKQQFDLLKSNKVCSAICEGMSPKVVRAILSSKDSMNKLSSAFDR